MNDITENILNYRNEKEFYKVERFLYDSSKKIDERISDLFYLSSHSINPLKTKQAGPLIKTEPFLFGQEILSFPPGR